MVRYLTTALSPAHPSMGVRNQRELRTLAEALDALIGGDLGRAADLLMQRFKAVELAATDAGGWAAASHLELIPEVNASSSTLSEREAAARALVRQDKLQKAIGGRGPVGRTR